MAKVTKKAVQKDNGKALRVQFTKERKQARLDRHLKNHPNDKQSKALFKNTERKKPFVKGSAPKARWKLRNSAGFVWAVDPWDKDLKASLGLS